QATSDGLNINVKEFMDTWIIQRNFPVVTVVQNMYNSSILHLTQERFLKFPETKHQDTSQSPFHYRWTIPLTLASSNHTIFNQTSGHHVYWMDTKEQSKTLHVSIPLPNCADPNGWVLVNLHQYGYYRVNYQVSNWLALSQQLKRNHSVIPVINRAQIIDDAWKLSYSNYTTIHVALATLEYLHNELEYLPWHTARTEINSIATKLESTPLDAPFKNFKNVLNTHIIEKRGTNINTYCNKIYNYKNCLFSGNESYHKTFTLNSDQHEIFIKELNKKITTAFDDKRYIYADGMRTLPHVIKMTSFTEYTKHYTHSVNENMRTLNFINGFDR
ncbi:unnamed protein product, partial [Candidula unifasciata]